MAEVQHVQCRRSNEKAFNRRCGEGCSDQHERFMETMQSKVESEADRDCKNLIHYDHEIEANQPNHRSRLE